MRWKRWKLGVVLAFSASLLLVPASASAASPTALPTREEIAQGLKEDPIVKCLTKVYSKYSKSNKPTREATQSCAPPGAAVIKTASGLYAIKVTSTGAPVGDPCATRSTRLYETGVMDRLDAGACWNWYSGWINWQRTGCYSWLPGAGCFWQSGWHDNSFLMGRAFGTYAQNCVWGWPCDGYLEIDQWFDGTWASYGW